MIYPHRHSTLSGSSLPLYHPLCGWYSGSCLKLIEQNLKRRQLKVLDFLQQIRMVPVPVTSEQAFYREDLLSNINTEEKYQDLLNTHRQA